jgi:hypothetical protein
MTKALSFAEKNATHFHQKLVNIKILIYKLKFVHHLQNLWAICQTPFAKKASHLVSRKKSCKDVNEIGPILDFANILCPAFTLIDPKNTKKTVKSSVILHLWDLQA